MLFIAHSLSRASNYQHQTEMLELKLHHLFEEASAEVLHDVNIISSITAHTCGQKTNNENHLMEAGMRAMNLEANVERLNVS